MKIKEAGLWKGSLVGGVIICAAALLLSLLGAYGMSKELLQENAGQWLSPVILFISVFIGAWIGAGKTKQTERMVIVLGAAALYVLVCILVKLFCFPGGTKDLLRNAIVTAAAAATAFFLRPSAGRSARRPSVTRRR